MELSEDLARIAGAAAGFAGAGEELAAVIPTEIGAGGRVYLCAFAGGDARRSWLALRDDGSPVADRPTLRDAVSIAAMCELAEESAGGGDLDDLRSRLVALRLTEDPPGIEEAQAAVDELQRRLDSPPRLATPAYLDDVGRGTRRLEQALGEIGRSPFSETMRAAVATVDELIREVEADYKLALV